MYANWITIDGRVVRWQLTADREDVPALVAEVRALREVMGDLIDPDDCEYDHHGYCQAHGWMETDPPCPQRRAKNLLGGAS